MIKEGWWIQYIPSPCLFLSLALSHPAMAWTVVEPSLLGSLVGLIVSWLTHQKGGKERWVRGEKAGGIKAATSEVGGRMREGGQRCFTSMVRAQNNKVTSEHDTPCSQQCTLPVVLHAESLIQTQRNLWLSDACRLLRNKILATRSVLHLVPPCSALPSTQK